MVPRLLAAKWKVALKIEAVDVLREVLAILAPLFVCTMPGSAVILTQRQSQAISWIVFTEISSKQHLAGGNHF